MRDCIANTVYKKTLTSDQIIIWLHFQPLLDLRGGSLLDGLIQYFVDELCAERSAELDQEGFMLLFPPGRDRMKKEMRAFNMQDNVTVTDHTVLKKTAAVFAS